MQDRIAYLGTPSDDIYLMSPDGTGQTNITNSSQRSETGQVFWSPNGQKIAYIAFDASVENLYVMNADGRGGRLLVNNFQYRPSWSPDSTKLVFSSRTQIYSINADGSGLTQLSNFMPIDSPFSGFNPSWSPDGSKILFTADATGKAIVVISSSVTPSSVGTKFRTVTVPVVTWESGLFANMGMTGREQ